MAKLSCRPFYETKYIAAIKKDSMKVSLVKCS